MTKSTNTVEQEPAVSRRQIVMAAAGIATAGVIFTWFSARSRPTTAADGPLVRPGRAKKLPPEQLAKELAKAGPLPEIIVGKEDAPVTIVEYADLTCPACGAFHKTVLPQLKEKYIDTGKVRILFREFPTTWPALLAVMTVRCAGAEKAWPLVSALFARQDDWRGLASNPDQFREKLFSFGQQVGLTRQTFDNCTPAIRDGKLDFSTPTQKKLLEDIVTVRNRAHETFSVSSTPTFFINGKRLPHATIEEFERVLAPLVTP
ncbi:MAG: DsbA family protein [Hyphomicrobiaceae bacterium]